MADLRACKKVFNMGEREVNRFAKIAAVAIIVAFLALSCGLQAAYINKIAVKVDQPDGTALELFASGDEFHNWLHDAEGFTVIRDPQTGWLCYAVKNGDDVAAGTLIAGRDDPRANGLEPGINISASLYQQRRQERFPMPAERDAPTTGTINNIVIYIRFSDEAEFGQLNSIYDGWFNSSTNSQKNYFLESSYSQLTVNTNFYPSPSSGYVVSWQDSHPRAYFQPYDATTNPTGYNGDTERTSREFTLLQNATNGVASQIPSSLTIDSDNDGRVDNVVYIVKGAAGAWSSLLWPHRWSLYDRNVYINGKRVYDFNFQLQTFLADRGVGVICHEFFHTLGAPDLYHYTGNGIAPAGSWDLMESDQNPPQHMTAFMKYKYGDWIASIPTISTEGIYTLNPLTSSTGQAYRINSNNPSQYYVVEFRKDTGTFESSIPGSGLLVYRIDTSCGDGNADGPPDELYIYRPNGTTTSNGTISSAHFSTETGRTAINSTTNPTPFLQNGSAGNLYLCEIGSSAGGTMTFRLGPPKFDFTINPHLQTFDATTFPPLGWTSAAETGTYAFTRVTTGGNPTCSPQSGGGMLRYNSDLAPAGNTALFITPKIVVSDAVNHAYAVNFWMYRDGNYGTTPDKIEVYLNASADLSGTPTLLGTIFRARQLAPIESIPGWKNYSFPLPFAAAGNYHVIFRAVSASGYNMFLDSVKVAQVPFAAITPGPADLAVRVLSTSALTWSSGGGGPTGYKLFLGTNTPPTNLTDLGNVLSYIPTLLPNTTYYWKIVPYGAGGDATNCPTWSFTTRANNDLQALLLQGSGYTLLGGELSYRVSILNDGALTQNTYNVRLLSADSRELLASQTISEPLAMDGTARHNLTWTPPNTGQLQVYAEVALAGDEVVANDATTLESAHIYPELTYNPVMGDPDTAQTANTLPLNFFWKNSLTETIYLADELQMQAGTISGIVYVNSFTQDLADKPVKIWLKNTAVADLSAGWLDFAGYTLVFDGAVDLPSGVNEIFIPFAQNFVYTGGNLAIRCNRPMYSVYFLSTNHFHYNASTLHPGRSRYLYSDTVTYDPTAPSTAGTLSNNIPLTAFLVQNPVLPVLAAPEVLISLQGDELALDWEQRLGEYGYKIYATGDPGTWPVTPDATVYTPGYQISLGTEARRFFKVQAFSYPYDMKSTAAKLFATKPNLTPAVSSIPSGDSGNKD